MSSTWFGGRWKTVLAAGMISTGMFVGGVAPVQAQEYGRYERRGPDSPVDETSRHLEMLAHRTGGYASGRERGRFDNAIRHLSQFQNRYYQGHFDKDKLDQAIEDVQNVIDHNPLDDRGRSLLFNDVNSLRAFRANRGYMR